MSKSDSYWKELLDQSEQEFASLDSTKESKERMFSAVMNQLPQGIVNTTDYHEAWEVVDRLSATHKVSKTEKEKNGNFLSRGPAPRQKERAGSRRIPFNLPRMAGLAAGFAALITVLVVSSNRQPALPPVATFTFNPPLTVSDVSESMSDKNFRTIAANNDIHLGYMHSYLKNENLELKVHSRSGEIDWESFYAVDDNNNLITPLNIDQDTNTIYFSPSGSDFSIEISDSGGNTIKCTIPSEI